MLKNRIKNLCKERNLFIADIEAKAGLSARAIARWNEIDPPVGKVYKVAKALNCTVEDLLKEE